MVYSYKGWMTENMKVFISWSGKKSCEVAKILKKWIPCIIQSVEPYFSSADIDKGARWSTDIAKELEIASFGILCVTKENLNSSWLNFEAGALSKSIDKAKVCPFLLGMKPSDIKDSPILQFQMTSINKEDVFQLFLSINKCLEDKKLDENVLTTTFETFWPPIYDELIKVDGGSDKEVIKESENKNSSMAIEEILELVRYQHKLLKSPTELLPREYFMDIMSKSKDDMISSSLISHIVNNLNRIKKLSMELMAQWDEEEKNIQLDNNVIFIIRDIHEFAERTFLLIEKYYSRRF